MRCAHDGYEIAEGTVVLLPSFFLAIDPTQELNAVMDMASDTTSAQLVFCSKACRKGYLVDRMFENPNMLQIHTMLFGAVKSAPDSLSLSMYHSNASSRADLLSIQDFRSNVYTLDETKHSNQRPSYFCAHDRHPFTWDPCHIPIQFMHDTQTFKLNSLTFCSPSCRLGYLTYDVNTKTEQYTLLYQYDTQRGVRVAQHAHTIRTFWNRPPTHIETVTVEEFRARSTRDADISPTTKICN
jgi:hypothetical protein